VSLVHPLSYHVYAVFCYNIPQLQVKVSIICYTMGIGQDLYPLTLTATAASALHPDM
jgi:hypothetical protein